LPNPAMPADPYTKDPLSPLFVVFRHVAGWPGYGVDSDGNVWSCRMNSGRFGDRWKRLGAHPNGRYGHLRVSFSVKPSTHGKRGPVHRFVHVLVLEAFDGLRRPGMECRHLNGNAADNRLSNLSWGTSAENAVDRSRHGRTVRGEMGGAFKLTEDDVRRIHEMHTMGKNPTEITREIGKVCRTMVRNIISGRSWSHVAPIACRRTRVRIGGAA
jgi:hypothetical protein